VRATLDGWIYGTHGAVGTPLDVSRRCPVDSTETIVSLFAMDNQWAVAPSGQCHRVDFFGDPMPEWSSVLGRYALIESEAMLSRADFGPGPPGRGRIFDGRHASYSKPTAAVAMREIGGWMIPF